MSPDWTTIASPACNGGRQITLRAPFVNNKIDPKSYSPVALRTLEHLPTPTDPCGLVQFGIKPSTNEDLSIGKVDYQRSEKHSLFARYELAHVVDPPNPVDPKNLLSTGTTTNGPYTTYPVVNDWKTHSFALGDTYLLGSSIVLDLGLEMDAVARLNKQIETCNELDDNNTRHLLEEILEDEEEHVDWIESQLSLIEQVGAQNYLAAQIREETS